MNRHYRFFDTDVLLSVPEQVGRIWDLLYANFAAGDARGRVCELTVEPDAGGAFTIRFGDDVRRVPETRVMVHLQDIVQNRILSGVTSHVLFHGAFWLVDGKGLLILAESGVGKSTLSLAHREVGGRVLSDEIAALDTKTGHLHAYPRSLAVRPASLTVCGINPSSCPQVMLDETKALIPVDADASIGYPLGAVALLYGPADDRGKGCHVFELSVIGGSDRWKEKLESETEGLGISPHPELAGWWRCDSPRPVKSAAISRAVEEAGGVLTGFHAGAFLAPDYTAPPVLNRLDVETAARSLMAHVVNAGALSDRIGAVRVMGEVRAMLSGVPVASCVPGLLNETRGALTQLVTPRP